MMTLTSVAASHETHKGPAADALLTCQMRRMLGRAIVLSGLLFLILATGCSAYDPGDSLPLDRRSNEVIIAWNAAAHDAAVAHDQYINGLAFVRVFAMLHLAQHDAINAIDSSFRTYAFHEADPHADPVAAAASAAHQVLSAVFPDQRASFDAQLARSLEAVPEGEAKTHGILLGARAGKAILAMRQNDGSDTPLVGDYVQGSGPGKYQFTPPYEFASLPGWRHVRPFTLSASDQFRPTPPPALASEEYARDFNEVKAIGKAQSPLRSPEQLAYAKFWEELSDRGWNRIARVAAAERGLGLQSTARLFALVNMAMSDSYVAGWDAKYHYDLWRPVTAIRMADIDGNDATEADTTWQPALTTPPVQDYPSTHSALGRAASLVLASVLGDETSFTFTSTSADSLHSSRSFTSFSQAALENADSRVVGGIHFRFACEAGLKLGEKVADWTIANYLQRR